MNKVEGSLTLTGIMDGTSLNGVLLVEGNPFIQRYSKGTNKFVPDFEVGDFDKRLLPTAILLITDTSDGSVLIPNPSTIKWKYNEVVLTFGEDNLCTNDGLEGVFEKIPSKPTIINGTSYNLPAIKVKKNLVPISGYDNDRLSVSGTVEMGGYQMPFQEVSKEVIIQETTGNAYTMNLVSENGQQISSTVKSIRVRADIYKDGGLLGEVAGITYKWDKVTSNGEVAMGTNREQTVTNKDVDSVLVLRCTATINSDKISAFITIVDISDPYIVQFDLTGTKGGTYIRKGETLKITPKAVKRSDNSQSVSGAISWNWSVLDNEGNPFTISGKPSSKFTADSVDVSFADIVRANMGMPISVGAEIII